MVFSLHEMDYYVREIDLTQHDYILYNPNNYMGGYGPIDIIYDYVNHEIESFNPDMIILVAGGLTFSEEVSLELKRKGIILLGITLSDPDVFISTKNYADRFTYHTTNSLKALDMYKKSNINNTIYMPFGVDSRFFLPLEQKAEYKSDITIISHFRPERLATVNELRSRFNTKVFGSNWPIEGTYPISYPEWVNVARSSNMIFDFTITGAGYFNVKVRLFEVAATATPLITQRLPEIEQFFEFGKEIIGYNTLDEAYEKINYYLKHEDELKQIGINAQNRCIREHTWKERFKKLFKQINF